MERAYRRWSTGEYIKPARGKDAFGESVWGDRTQLYMGTCKRLSDEQWEDIINKATRAAKEIGKEEPEGYLVAASETLGGDVRENLLSDED